MFDAAGVAHARRADDDLGFRVIIDRFGLLCRDREPQVGEGYRVDPLCQKIQCLLIIALVSAFIKDLRGVHGKGTVHIDREIGKIGHQIILLYLPDIIQDDLRPAHCESRDHNIAPSVESL